MARRTPRATPTTETPRGAPALLACAALKASLTLAETRTPDGATLSLRLHDGRHQIFLGGRELMSSAATGSEMRLAELACEAPSPGPRGRFLIGGLGLGFTLRRVLELAGAEARVHVAELLPEVVAWNREHLREVNGALLDDPRVELTVGDVFALLVRAKAGAYDAVLLDVDNGPRAMVARANARLYDARGLQVLARALRAGGRAVFWSASRDRSFLAALTRAGFRAQAVGAKAYPQAKRETHTLFVADRGA